MTSFLYVSQESCSVVNSDGHVVDLSALSSTSTYSADSIIPDDKYFSKFYYDISVCQTLPVDGSNRCPGATVCMINKDNIDNFWVSECRRLYYYRIPLYPYWYF